MKFVYKNICTVHPKFTHAGCRSYRKCSFFILVVYFVTCLFCMFTHIHTVCTVRSRYLRAPKGMSSMRLMPRLSNLSMGSESIIKLDHVNRPQGLCNCLLRYSSLIRHFGRRFFLIQYMYVEYICLPVQCVNLSIRQRTCILCTIYYST